MQTDNDERYYCAGCAINQYASEKEGCPAGTLYDVPEAVATDLLSDVLHWIERQGGCPMQALRLARFHYESER